MSAHPARLSWSLPTPFGTVRLDFSEDGKYRITGPSGRVDELDGGSFVEPDDGGPRVPMPSLAADRWWWGLPEGAGAIGWVPDPGVRTQWVALPSGTRLPLPRGWRHTAAPQADTLFPAQAARPGLPPSSFVEAHETLLPELPDDALQGAVGRLLQERTQGGAVRTLEPLSLRGCRVLRSASTAAMPTGEFYEATLWMVRSGHYLLTLAQTNLREDPQISDDDVRALIEGANLADLRRDPGVVGSFARREEWARGPVQELVVERFVFEADGAFRTRRESTVVEPGGVAKAVAEPSWTYGFWARAGARLVLSRLWEGCESRQIAVEPPAIVLDGQRFEPEPLGE